MVSKISHINIYFAAFYLYNQKIDVIPSRLHSIHFHVQIITRVIFLGGAGILPTLTLKNSVENNSRVKFYAK